MGIVRGKINIHIGQKTEKGSRQFAQRLHTTIVCDNSIHNYSHQLDTRLLHKRGTMEIAGNVCNAGVH